MGYYTHRSPYDGDGHPLKLVQTTHTRAIEVCDQRSESARKWYIVKSGIYTEGSSLHTGSELNGKDCGTTTVHGKEGCENIKNHPNIPRQYR